MSLGMQSALSLPEAIVGHDKQRRPRGHSTGSRLIQNTIANFLGQAVVIALTFVSTPYMTRKLGATQYGALSLLMAYLFAFSLLNLGINRSLVKYLAELLPKGQLGDMQNYLSTSLTLLVGIGLLIAVFVCLLADPIVRHCFKGPAELTAPTILALRVASVAFVLQFLVQVVSAIPAAVQRFEILNLVRAGSEALRIVGTVALLSLGYGLPSLMVMVLLASFCALLAYGVAARRLVPALKVVPGFSRSHFHSLFRHSKYVMVGNVGNQVVSTADNFLIGYFLPVANLAYYGIAHAIAQRLWGFVGNMVSVVFPAASTFTGAGQQEQLKQLYLRGMKVGAAAACFPVVTLCMFSRPFLLYWLGPDYAQEGAVVLSLLTLGFLLNSFSHVPYQVLQSTYHAATAAKGTVAYAIVNLTLFVLLIPPFGIVGASAGFLIAQFLYVPWFVQTANRLLGLRWRTVVAVSYLPVFLATGVTALACWACRPWVHSLFTVALAVAASFLVYASLGFVLVLDAKDKVACRLLLHRWVLCLQRTIHHTP